MKKAFVYSILLQLLFTVHTMAQQTVTAATALEQYLYNRDTTCKWELIDSAELESSTAYQLLLTSQQWHGYTWTHQLTVLIPRETRYDGALLFITGGSNNKETGLPNWSGKNDRLVQQMGTIAARNAAIVAVLRQVPHQPIFSNLTEDAAISYTLHQFKQDNDYSWPLLFPMVKSAVRAMDAVQEFSKQRQAHKVNRFVVAGASKRGWTTWLTGANDPRVTAIGPMVIDVLNMPANLQHQIDAYGGYSVEIEDYVKLGIVQGMTSPLGRELVTMIDPFAYRKKLTMPKMIFIGTNDPYWVVDNVKNYLDSIPGNNLLHYTPNAGHDLNRGVTAMPALSAFFGIALARESYPVCNWSTKVKKKRVELNITATTAGLKGITLWQAGSEDQDFRNETWKGRELPAASRSSIRIREPLPAKGYQAFYAELKYERSNGDPYTVCTRVFVTDPKRIL
ncbi:PhoPQ-activated pathogenicity-related family protein [Niabella sp. CC-SYL272]|uniref:PhoPQ-activated pathogenicity-related family protein n=1 Tax=Niabella agricola TaxID=2891571 RepID=UPI001F1CE060|nr:PhoPQ-activated protein PqaA family protein [Niabella agricola]MCF3107395.1 PhoPQ-activated pathogenicity-related family protein [Niabella agricola]